jgi:hypothetical protein
MADPKQDPKQDEAAIRTSLQASLDQAEWAWLQKHAERDVVIVVAQELSIVETGVKIALDDTAAVRAWLMAGQLIKPRREQLEAWNAEPAKRFMSLVVQPYVLVQELPESAPEGMLLH